MTLGLVWFTPNGERLAQKILSLPGRDFVVRLEGTSAKTFVQENLSRCDGFIFIGAVGIAVRTFAPYIRSKDSDPALVVLDELGRYAIPVLSGHLGGANELARSLATYLGAQAVVTTATDLNGVFAVDVWSRKSGCAIADIARIKDVSSALLRGEPVGLACDFPVEGELPEGVEPDGQARVGICVSLDDKKSPFPVTLHAVPRIVTLGAGCRRGTDPAAFETFVLGVLERQRISVRALHAVASIDLKKDESCLLDFCRKYSLALRTYPAEKLRRVEGAFTVSAFVSSVTGVDNVCERAAVCALEEHSKSGADRSLILRKTSGNGITAALAAENWRCVF